MAQGLDSFVCRVSTLILLSIAVNATFASKDKQMWRQLHSLGERKYSKAARRLGVSQQCTWDLNIREPLRKQKDAYQSGDKRLLYIMGRVGVEPTRGYKPRGIFVLLWLSPPSKSS